MDKLTYYKTALWLSLVVALTSFVGWSIIFVQNPHLTKSIAINAVPFLICFGIWVQSITVSSVGVLWMAGWAAALIWPMLSSPIKSTWVMAFFVISAALNLATAGLMLTKKFRNEFAYARAHQSKYKLYLKRLVFAVVVAAMLIATFNDIINLASD